MSTTVSGNVSNENPPPTYSSAVGEVQKISVIAPSQQAAYTPGPTHVGYTLQIQQPEYKQPQAAYGTHQGAVFSVSPSAAAMFRSSPGEEQPNDYQFLALFVTILCCLPVGFAAVAKSSEVRRKWLQGDHRGAKAASVAARNWSIVGLVMGSIVFIGVIVVWLLILIA